MRLRFAGPRNRYGHRKYIAFDTETKEYATNPRGWIDKADPQVRAKDIKSIELELQFNGYRKIENL